MEPSLPFSTDPGIKEDQDLTSSGLASASSSSRLSNLSSSTSRRLRHVSPPPSSRPTSQRKGLGTGQAQLTPQKSTYPEAFHNVSSASPALSTNEGHRTSSQTTVAVTNAYKVIRGIVFLWKWFCVGYFCITILDKLTHLTIDWRNSQSAVIGDSLLSMVAITWIIWTLTIACR
jgi:hypothetical protein